MKSCSLFYCPLHILFAFEERCFSSKVVSYVGAFVEDEFSLQCGAF